MAHLAGSLPPPIPGIDGIPNSTRGIIEAVVLCLFLHFLLFGTIRFPQEGKSDKARLVGQLRLAL